MISSIFLIIHSLYDLFWAVKKKLSIEMPRMISHFGFGLLIFFIGINHNYSIERDFNLKVGGTKIFNDYKIDFNSLKTEDKKNYKTIIGEFVFTDLKDNSKEILKPEIRIYSHPETLTYEASIKTKFFSDIYLTMSNITRSEYYNIKFQNKPFMFWIWFSAILVSFGGFMRLLKKRTL